MTFPSKTRLVLILLAAFSIQTLPLQSTRAQSAPQKAPVVTTVQQPPPPAKGQTKEDKEPDYSAEALVIEQVKTRYRFEKDGTGQRELTLRVRVQSEAALQRFGQLVLPYSSANEKLEIDYIRVRKANGAVVTASTTDVQDLTAPISREAPVYTDLHQKHVTVPGLRPGDTLDYHVVWQLHTPLAANHFWLNHDFVADEVIVLDDQLEVDIPGDSTVKLKTAKGFEPTIREAQGRRLYNWKHSVLKRSEEKPDEKEQARRWREEYEDPKPPQVQMTTFKSWDEVGQWYAALERDRIVPDEKVRAKANELVRGLSSDADKVATLYEYVAKNFRYVSLSLGQGRYQPHAAADVFANQYGDCKDKHTLLSAMLIAAGLRAYPALMNSSRKIDPDMPSPAQFDHVISAIQLGGQTLWADTTSEVAPFRLLAPPLRDKKALVIPVKGLAQLETTPAEPPFTSAETIVVEGQVNDLGQLKGHAHMTLRGDTEMYYRIMFRRTPKGNWNQLGYMLSSTIGVRGGEVDEVKPSDPAALEKPFEVDFNFTRDDFLDWSIKKEKVAIPLPTLHLAEVDPDDDESSKPIQLGAPIVSTYSLKLTLPAKYSALAPVPLKVTRDYGDYSSNYKLEQNILTADRTYRLKQHELPAARTQDYAAFVAAARSDEAQTLSVETSIAGAPAIPDSVKVEDLISTADTAVKNGNYVTAEQLLRRALEKEPKHKTVRRQLGWALFAQRKFDETVEVLRDQSKLNPFDNYAYNLMGRALWAQQKYEESESAFRKQIEVAPLDKWVHGNLGQMLVEWRKFKEAVPELEQGISLNPEDKMLYVSLGRAYLNLDQADKATESFDKAIKLAPEPLVWNDVAYDLSLSKVRLDKAQQYAESAVTYVATELRNAELDRLTMKDLAAVSAIAAYWDTLGWVFFQKGDLDAAERYITAAWLLAQHGEVGYHLGQIYEKRGKKDEAISMYAQATVAERPPPEVRDSLAKLVAGDKLTAALTNAKRQLAETRTVKLTSLLKNEKAKTEAEFYVVFGPGLAQSAQPLEVKFISGDEKLRPLVAALKSASYKMSFPDQTATKLIRRGTLVCQPNGECSFVMVAPEFVIALD